MVAVAVTFDGATRVNDADANTNWSNLGGGGPSPASEAQLRYQGTGAVNRKVTSTGSRTGVQYDPAAGAVDMTAAANPLWFFKGNVADFGDLNATYGVEARIGSASGAYYAYAMAGTDANRAVFDEYPAKGGYLIAAINPNISSWREATSGSPSLTAVDYFGIAAQFVVGGAKSENVAMDAIDIGRGLLLVSGSGADADGTFIDFLDTDQDTSTNRWGVVDGGAPVVNCRGLLTIGSATETDFPDDTSVVLFVDGYHGPGDVGVLIDLSNASSVITIGATLIGLGSITTSDTRPDYVVTGTSGAHTLTGTLSNHRNVTFTSVVDCDGASLECDLLTQATAEIQNAIINTTSAASIACLQDPTFGSATDLHDSTFIQAGAGHALEIDTAGAYTFTNLTFTGYGADTTDSAALDITAGTGTVTITLVGSPQPTFKTAGAAVVFVTNPVTLAVTVLDSLGLAIEGVAVTILASDGTGDLPFEDVVTITQTAGVATVAHTAHDLATGNKVAIRDSTIVAYNGIKTITVTGVNAYTFPIDSGTTSPATGTILSTGIVIDGLTNVSGNISDTRSYSVDQPVEGDARKGTHSPVYKPSPISGAIDKDAGLPVTVSMTLDE